MSLDNYSELIKENENESIIHDNKEFERSITVFLSFRNEIHRNNKDSTVAKCIE